MGNYLGPRKNAAGLLIIIIILIISQAAGLTIKLPGLVGWFFVKHTTQQGTSPAVQAVKISHFKCSRRGFNPWLVN